MHIISTIPMHPLCRISTAVEDVQELQLQWLSNDDSQDQEDYEDYYYGNVECLYNECDDDIDIIKSSPPSEYVITGATKISTGDASTLVTTSSSSSSSTSSSSSSSLTSSRLSFSSSSSLSFSSSSSSLSSLQHDTDSLDLLRVDDQCYTSEQQQKQQQQQKQLQQQEDVYKQQDNDEKHTLLCPVTGQYSNIHDHYYLPQTFSSIIGTGQYGSVQSCIHIPTGKSYAVKTIQKSQMKHCLNHLHREIHLLTKVTSHPNILKLIDFHEDETHVYIITERYTGGELFNVIAENTTRSGCLNEAYAASIIKSLLEAVEYLHSLGIVHRDLKPENILFESERDDDDNESGYCDHFATNSIRLIDFGLSIEHNIKVDGEYLTDTVGTSYYMSPEVIMGKYTKSCDIWSVGIITYILLCGYPPFNGENEQDVKETILLHGHAENVNFKLRGWDGKSDEVKDFIKCLLRRDPRKRFTAQQALMHPWLKIYC